MIEDISYIRFRNQSQVQHKDYIEFTSSRGCYSFVGRSEKGRQEIKLNEICAQIGIHMIIHEVCIKLTTKVVRREMSHLHQFSAFKCALLSNFFRCFTLLVFTTSTKGQIGTNLSILISRRLIRIIIPNLICRVSKYLLQILIRAFQRSMIQGWGNLR